MQRDFLVEVLEEGTASELFTEERAAEAAAKAAREAQLRAAVPGLLNPYAVTQADDDL